MASGRLRLAARRFLMSKCSSLQEASDATQRPWPVLGIQAYRLLDANKDGKAPEVRES